MSNIFLCLALIVTLICLCKYTRKLLNTSLDNNIEQVISQIKHSSDTVKNSMIILHENKKQLLIKKEQFSDKKREIKTNENIVKQDLYKQAQKDLEEELHLLKCQHTIKTKSAIEFLITKKILQQILESKNTQKAYEAICLKELMFLNKKD